MGYGAPVLALVVAVQEYAVLVSLPHKLGEEGRKFPSFRHEIDPSSLLPPTTCHYCVNS